MPQGDWSEGDFERISWHDNHVHALRILPGDHGLGEFALDLDHILEWRRVGEAMRFLVVPATLRFRAVSALRIALDYAAASAALGPFSIDAIERRDEPRERHVAQLWRIAVNWPPGEIAFEASGFEQRARGTPVLSELQHLLPAERLDAAPF